MTTLNQETLDELIKLRKHIHANPELSEKEKETATLIKNYLEKCSPSKLITDIGGHGVIAIFDSGIDGKSILFRADTDALPIQETNNFEHQSKVKGVSHKCGHDGHTCALLGFAKILSKQPPKKGKAILLFQPAEEEGIGAKAVLNDEKFKSIEPDYVFAFHNLPGYPLNEIVIKNGSFTSAVKSIIIKFNGKTSHAAEPEKGINPALPIADIIKECDTLSNNQPEREDFTLITPIHINMGEIAYGISAGYGELRLTIRTWSEQYMDDLSSKLVELIKSTSKKYNIDIDYNWTHEFSANENHDNAFTIIKESATKLSLQLTEREYPFKWGEDFGLFTQQFKGAMFGIGSGETCPALHNPDYDFPDEILPNAIQLFHQISLSALT